MLEARGQMLFEIIHVDGALAIPLYANTSQVPLSDSRLAQARMLRTQHELSG